MTVHWSGSNSPGALRSTAVPAVIFFADGHRISSEEIAHATRETHVLRGPLGDSGTPVDRHPAWLRVILKIDC